MISCDCFLMMNKFKITLETVFSFCVHIYSHFFKFYLEKEQKHLFLITRAIKKIKLKKKTVENHSFPENPTVKYIRTERMEQNGKS